MHQDARRRNARPRCASKLEYVVHRGAMAREVGSPIIML
jgi:hypothetical protein